MILKKIEDKVLIDFITEHAPVFRLHNTFYFYTINYVLIEEFGNYVYEAIENLKGEPLRIYLQIIKDNLKRLQD